MEQDPREKGGIGLGGRFGLNREEGTRPMGWARRAEGCGSGEVCGFLRSSGLMASIFSRRWQVGGFILRGGIIREEQKTEEPSVGIPWGTEASMGRVEKEGLMQG